MSFLVDDRLRVIGDGAIAVQPASGAVGRRCWEVRVGEPRARAPALCAGCPMLGEDAARVRSGERCSTLALSERPGVTLIAPPACASGPEPDQAISHLAILGAISSVLIPGTLAASLDRALEILRHACAADDCELFLCEPDGGDLLLTACRGPDRDALVSRSRFPRGEGYPGSVVARGQPLLTHNLEAERRFSQGGATEVALRTYLGVPVAGPRGPIGCVGVAWQSGDARVDRAAEVLTRASATLGVAVLAGMADAHERLTAALESAEGSAAPARRRAFLDAVIRASGAPSATMVLFSHPGEEPAVVSTALADVRPQEICVSAVDGGRLKCSLLEGGHGVALGPHRCDWPTPCRRLPAEIEAPYCLPLLSDRQLQGVVLVDYRDVPPEPLTRNVVQLLALTRHATLDMEPPIAAPASGIARSAAPTLTLRCFGKLEIRLDNDVVPTEAFPRKKALVLLKLLVLRHGNPVSRDALVEHLWPGAGDKAGANRLHVVVHALRSVLEPFRDKRRWLFIRNHGELYYFDTESPHWIDLYAFRRLADVARDRERAGDVAEALVHLEEAAALYRGNLFEDEPYAEWCTLERDELRSVYLDVVRRLAALYAQLGKAEQAVACLRRGLLVDPLREDLHQALIETLASLGRRSDALDQYRECARLLRVELGAEPLPATQRLERLVAGTPALLDPLSAL